MIESQGRYTGCLHHCLPDSITIQQSSQDSRRSRSESFSQPLRLILAFFTMEIYLVHILALPFGDLFLDHGGIEISALISWLSNDR